MSEADGPILIKAPRKLLTLLKTLDQGADGIGPQPMSALFSYAGLPSRLDRDTCFYLRSIEQRKDFLVVSIFGDEWMDATKSLVKKGEHIELYGFIEHEHGFIEYYALNDRGQRFCESIDFEVGNEVKEQKMVATWLTFIPDKVKKSFPDIFEEFTSVPAHKPATRFSLFQVVSRLLSRCKMR